MDLKYALILLPLVWAISMFIFTGNFEERFTGTLLVSFILSAIGTVALAGFHVFDTGMSEAFTWIVFILVFGGMFYGVSVASSYLETPSNIDISMNDGVIAHTLLTGTDKLIIPITGYEGFLTGNYWSHGGANWTTVPTYIKEISFSDPLKAGFTTVIQNPNFNLTQSTQIGLAFGTGSNEGFNNSMFRDMPYFSIINIIFGIMYMFGLYFLVATHGGK